MVSGTVLVTGALIALASRVSAHASIWDKSMYGFNKSDTNRAQDPLMYRDFKDWWYHGHMELPPNPGDVAQLPAGGSHTFEISCDKDSTSFWESGPGGNRLDLEHPDWPCPGQPSTTFHANNISDLGGCALGVAYKSDIHDVTPDEIAIFSVNQTCVWHRFTDFHIPARMPPCPEGGCICSWHWLHLPDSGSEQMYMTGFKCNFTGTTWDQPIPPPKVARRCGYDKIWDVQYDPNNCTLGPKAPFYWLQNEGNNTFEDPYHAPSFTDLYYFLDGAQNDMFWPDGKSNDNTSSTIPSSTTSPMPSNNLPAGEILPSSPTPPSSSPSSYSPPYPSTSSPSPSPSYSPDPAMSPLPSSSSYSPDPVLSLLPLPSSSSPAGNVDPSNTLSMPGSLSSHSSKLPSSLPNPSPTMSPNSHSQPSPSPSPKNSNGKCRPRSSTSSSYLPTQSPAHDNNGYRRSSLEDKPAKRRVWGHRRGGNA